MKPSEFAKAEARNPKNGRWAGVGDYARIYFHDKNNRPVTLHVLANKNGFLHGWELDANGDRGERQRLIDHDAIRSITPLVMNLKYAELEPSGVKARREQS